MLRLLPRLTAFLCLVLPSPALAWGDEGHRAIALVARSYLTSPVRAKVDAILASDPDTLTAPDMASRATWADAWRNSGHRETATWHFVDIEIDAPDLKRACFGFPAPASPASAGPAQDCVVDKIREFQAELAAPTTDPAERLLALKYILHFVGDLHQPLHSSDDHDRGGNCIPVSLCGTRTVNLHSYWDTVLVAELGPDAPTLAASLRARITPAQVAQWSRGDASAWAQEAFAVARSSAYRVNTPAGCNGDVAPITLPLGYDAKARAAATLQLQRAGVRLAFVLNAALAKVAVAPVPAAVRSGPVVSSMPFQGRADPPASGTSSGRTPASLACSAQADRQGLHGPERQRFRRRCIRAYPGTITG